MSTLLHKLIFSKLINEGGGGFNKHHNPENVVYECPQSMIYFITNLIFNHSGVVASKVNHKKLEGDCKYSLNSMYSI